jgi:hypothetical protein
MFARVCLVYGNSCLKLIPAIYALALAAMGVLLVVRARSPISKRIQFMFAVFVVVLVISPVLLDIHIRHDSKLLQSRAKAFLLRPLPKLLIPDSNGNVGGFFVDTNSGPQNGVLGYSIKLIERYATNGRIRWSAVIQGQFACTGKGVNMNYESDEIRNSEEVSSYLAERNAILDQEWNMGFWQWVEDTIEMKMKIPEIEEEDAKPTASRDP